MLRRAELATATATVRSTKSVVAVTRKTLSGRSGRSHPGQRLGLSTRTSLLHPAAVATRAAARAPSGASPLSSASVCSLASSLCSPGSGVTKTFCRGHRNVTSASRVTFTAPPEDLEDGYFERPTPVLLVAGEGQPASWWRGVASFFARRGCTVGTMTLTGRGSSPTETLGLRALQSGVAAAVEKSGLTPPVIVAHSIAGFVCQQYLQSYSASGLVLLDSFPPIPRDIAIEHLKLASTRAGNSHHADVLTEVPPDLTSHELAQLMKDDPKSWEGLLRTHFEDLHRHFSFPASLLNDPGLFGLPVLDGDAEVEGASASVEGTGPRFPVKAFAEMCLGQPSSTLRLESHAVETLVLGSVVDVDGNDPEHRSRFGGHDMSALNSARRNALESICEFHGTQGWSTINGQQRSDEKIESHRAGNGWAEVIWDWYDARF